MRTIFIAVIVIAIVGVGGYFIITNYVAPTSAPEDQAGVTDQVQIQDVAVGEGEEAAPGSVVSVLYVGRFEDGTVFDSSEAHGNEPLKFTLGEPGLIQGFQIGVNGMHVGGERLMVIPPPLGYGAQEVRDPEGKLIIPANAVLIFNVQLLSVEAASPPTE